MAGDWPSTQLLTADPTPAGRAQWGKLALGVPRWAIGIWDFNKDPGLVCDRPRAIILARSLASRRSIVAALIATSKAASPSLRSSSPSRRMIGTRTSSIGASRLPAGTRRTAQHLTNATMTLGHTSVPEAAEP